MMLKNLILVFMGGGIGAAGRELLMLVVSNLPGGFPMPIFIANMTAALLIGVLSALTVPGGVIGSGGKLLLTTGIMGGLSTFSSFIWATDKMLANPAEQASAIVYLVLSMVGGLLLVEAGLWLGGRLRSRLKAAGANAH
jgi:fluoride exporter